MKLDGSDKISPTPFDATEQVVRSPHTFVPVANASVEAHDASGYKADPDFEPSEYPKAIDHVQKDGAPEGHLEPVIAKDESEDK